MLAALLALALATLDHDGQSYPLYPATTAQCPDLPSPLTIDGREYVIFEVHDGTFGLADVTLADHPEQVTAAVEFPALAARGLHDAAELDAVATVNGRTWAEIDEAARPGGLSWNGFVAADESAKTVIRADNELVRTLGLTHPDLARPLWHIWNLMQHDLDLDRWSMAHHQWRNVRRLKYHDHWIELDAHDTKGGQKSPFGDPLDGGFWMVFRRALTDDESAWLHEHYGRLDPARWDEMVGTLSRVYTGEMVAFFITWYGFYEGHTAWRVDPVGAARVFGLRTLEELEAAFPGRLDEVLLEHHVAVPGS